MYASAKYSLVLCWTGGSYNCQLWRVLSYGMWRRPLEIHRRLGRNVLLLSAFAICFQAQWVFCKFLQNVGNFKRTIRRHVPEDRSTSVQLTPLRLFHPRITHEGTILTSVKLCISDFVVLPFFCVCVCVREREREKRNLRIWMFRCVTLRDHFYAYPFNL
jgi:hypothetical protein